MRPNINFKICLPIVLGVLYLSGCTSSKPKVSSVFVEPPLQIVDPYFQAWIGGVQGGGSGINLFLPTHQIHLDLDSVYFRGMMTKVQTYDSGFVARYRTALNSREDLIMSTEQHAEFGNQPPRNNKFKRFDIEENACVLSFDDQGVVKYFLVQGITERPTIPYPSASPQP